MKYEYLNNRRILFYRKVTVIREFVSIRHLQLVQMLRCGSRHALQFL